jgi:hypothetical protein
VEVIDEEISEIKINFVQKKDLCKNWMDNAWAVLMASCTELNWWLIAYE